jgi:hypothetical protein
LQQEEEGPARMANLPIPKLGDVPIKWL